MKKQNYMSRQLSHFVGRKCGHEFEQEKILNSILEEKLFRKNRPEYPGRSINKAFAPK